MWSIDAVADRISDAVAAVAARSKLLVGTATTDSDGHVQVQVGAQVWTATDATGRVAEGDLVVISEQANTRRVVINTTTAGALELPVGGIILWPGSSAPSGGVWAICNGASYSSTDYPALYAVLGSTSLPDLRDRFPRGASASAAVKSTGGSTTISASNMPNHSHSMAHDHAIRNESSNIGASGSTIGEEFLGSSTSRGWRTGASSAANTGTAGSGAAYWQPYYSAHYLIRMV